MEGHAQRSGESSQKLGSLQVNRSAVLKNSKDNAVRPNFSGGANVVLHDLEFVGRVGKITAPRTNHHVQWNGDLRTYRSHRPQAGRNAAFEKIGAEFNPVRASGLGRNCRFDRVGANLQND